MREMSYSDALKEAFDCHLNGNWPRAEELYCKLIAADEANFLPYFGLGTMYAQHSAPGRAIALLRKSLELKPDNAEAMLNLAAVYRRLENKDEALKLSHASLALERSPLTLSNIAGIHVNDGTPLQAIAYADEALAMLPGFPPAGNHRALGLLELGRFKEGWAQYESRRGINGWGVRPYTCPMWSGEKVKTLAISGEQGLGDEIMFMTALRQVQKWARVVVVECAARLVPLLQNSFPECRFYATYAELAAAEKPDAWTHMGSMQRWIWPVQPKAYLRPSTLAMRTSTPRIGWSWRGGTAMTHERLRNFGLDKWKQMIPEGADNISLQYGQREGDAQELGLPHDSAAIADLDLLAARIKSCDLVVSICNTTIHMAGALGVPCIVLVPSKPAWRYGLTGEKMVWYESVTMIRQGKDENWRSVVERVQQKIADYGVIPRIESAIA